MLFLSDLLELICDFRPEVPDYVVGDPVRIRQIITNLVGNAIKFTERGRITVTVECLNKARCLDKTDQQASLILGVRDTGIGIEADKLELIFEKFTQADGSMTRRYGGTGLGLTIVKQLVSVMGGEIDVESRVGVGTAFTVALSLPLAQATDEVLVEQLTGKEVRQC